MHVGAGKPVPLPNFVDLSISPYMPPVYDQGQLGSCTANAIAACVDFERRKQGMEFITPSRLAIYYGERSIEGSVANDDGAAVGDGLQVVANQGVGPEAMWPYDESKFAVKPPNAYYMEAVHHRATNYSRVSQADYYIGHCLSIRGQIVPFGMNVYNALESDQVAATGILPMPVRGETPIGGHALDIVGRDVAGDRYKLRNSWGAAWGLKGYLWIPRSYVLNPQLASDLWTIATES